MTDSVTINKPARATVAILFLAMAVSACAAPFTHTSSVTAANIDWMQNYAPAIVNGL